MLWDWRGGTAEAWGWTPVWLISGGGPPHTGSVLVFQQVHRIVNQALKRYSEDRIGMVDYALESGGVWPLASPQPASTLAVP